MALEPECTSAPDVQALVLAEIKDKSRLIHQQQSKADRGEFKSYGGAVGLQRLRLDRIALWGRLCRPRLVTLDGVRVG